LHSYHNVQNNQRNREGHVECVDGFEMDVQIFENLDGRDNLENTEVVG
jgi:hypothetical protein